MTLQPSAVKKHEQRKLGRTGQEGARKCYSPEVTLESSCEW